MATKQTAKGNKAHLPSKLCVYCERLMTWRKSWEKNWEQVKYCSDACMQAAARARRAGTRTTNP